MITKARAVLCLCDEPTPIAYLNIYEEGDIWIKIKGCETCTLEHRRLCCDSCPMFTSLGCHFHLEVTQSKPFRCVINPTPDICQKWCNLEFKCIEGSKKGYMRRVKDIDNEFIKVE